MARLAAIFKQCFCFDVVIASKSPHVKEQGKLTDQREYEPHYFYEIYLKIKMCQPDHLNVQYQLFHLCHWTGLKWFISLELALCSHGVKWVHYHYHFHNLFLKLVDHYHVTGIESVCILTTLPLSQKSFFPGILWHYYWVWVRMRTMGLRKWSFVTAKAVLIFVC